MNFSKQVEDIIADFRGLPRTTTGSMKQAPVSLDTILEGVKEKYDLERPSPERVIIENWNNIFGKLAGRCNPLSLKNGRTLTVSVMNQTLRSELQFRKQTLLRTIQSLPHCENITEIIIRA
jgi:hypothetical protein